MNAPESKNLITLVKALFEKYKRLIAYAFFGVCTTIVNVVCYTLFYNVVHVSNLASTALAWLFAVLFAFVTNKLWVFGSKSFEKKTLVRELATFFACRIATGALDMLIMWITVDRLRLNPQLCKFASNVVVIILNYIFSKLIIFVKK